jgi:hypothetical protein
MVYAAQQEAIEAKRQLAIAAAPQEKTPQQDRVVASTERKAGLSTLRWREVRFWTLTTHLGHFGGNAAALLIDKSDRNVIIGA